MESTSRPDARPVSYSTDSSSERLDRSLLPLLQQPSASSSPLYIHAGASESSIETPGDEVPAEMSSKFNAPQPAPATSQALLENSNDQSPIPYADYNSPPQIVCNDDDTFAEPQLSSTTFTVEEEQLLENPLCGRRFGGAFILDLRYRRRALLYQHFISNLEPLRILSNVGDGTVEMLEYPGLSKEDFELLKTVTKTYGDRRWWKIQIDDIACPQCVAEFRVRRGFKKSKLKQAWLKVKNKVKRICHCGNWEHDFKCTHKTKDTNKVTRFCKTLGRKNMARMVNIELDTNPYVLLDADVLASAAQNVGHYFTDLRRIALHFRFLGPVPREPDHIESIACSMAKMESLLPWRGRLVVDGIEYHEALKAAWAEKSRKYWE